MHDVNYGRPLKIPATVFVRDLVSGLSKVTQLLPKVFSYFKTDLKVIIKLLLPMLRKPNTLSNVMMK